MSDIYDRFSESFKKLHAYEIAESILAEPGIVQVFNHAGYCRKCRQPLAGATVDLTKLKMRIAEEIKKAMSMRNEK